MQSYINIDPNMVVRSKIENVDVNWYDVRQAPFSIHGLYEPLTEPYFRRVPAEVADATSEGVSLLAQESAGGRVRFSTDSAYVAIRAKFRVVGRSPHLTLLSSSGFDLYEDGEFGSRFVREFRMPYDMTDTYEAVLGVDVKSGTMRSFTINFPVHAVVEKLEVGLHPDAKLAEARPYRGILPIAFYGSSIVHGTAAGRPGLIYPAIISRDLNMDFYDIGFSGQAKGEAVLGRWMATLPMSAFVCDYDYNAPDPAHLEATHYPLYEIIREKNPDLPYLMVTRPNFWTQPCSEDDIFRRREVVMTSYLKARQNGDKNVYFVDGLSFGMASHTYDLSMDSIHPNDAGFLRMADCIGLVLKHILAKK